MTAEQVASLLPSPATLERTSRAIAALDSILIANEFFRTFTYQPNWAADTRLAAMDNGSGDQYQIAFSADATVVRAFDHESELSPWALPDGQVAAGLLDGFPLGLLGLIDEPSFRTDGGPRTDLTFCAWTDQANATWLTGTAEGDGGAHSLLELVLDATPSGYQRYAADYLEIDVAEDLIAQFFENRPATEALLLALNPAIDRLASLEKLTSMGYPTSTVE